MRRRLIGLANFSPTLFPSFVLPKIFFSKKLIGTLITKAIAPPSTNGNIIPHIVFSTSITTSNFHNATTSSTVKIISSRIFFIDNLLKSIIILLMLKSANYTFMQQDIFHHILKIILMSRRFINSAWHCICLVIMLFMNVMQRINIRY